MKRKPDSMVALVLIFCVGMAITGITSVFADDSVDHNRPASTEYTVSRY